jgi:ABC-type multidrug transport system ATPase subunit
VKEKAMTKLKEVKAKSEDSGSKARQYLGYCPQFDCLPDYLTVKEAMILFSELRGISSNLTRRLVDDMISIFQLNEF